MKRMKTKGQSALEASFVVMFIIVAVGFVLADTATYNSRMSIMAESRAQAQAAAFELSMRGIDTYLVRVDPAAGGPSEGVIVYYVSEGCASDYVEDVFNDTITAEIAAGALLCEKPYTDEKFNI